MLPEGRPPRVPTQVRRRQPPFGLDEILAEMQEFGERLAAGAAALRELPAVEVGATPKEAVHREDKLVLYRYRRRTPARTKIPVLIVYALVNRPYMADLQPDRSTIRGLLRSGLDVYLLDWGYPDAADRYLALEDYLEGYLHRAVVHVCRTHAIDQVNLLGICQGGTLSLCYSALHPERVRNLITMVTPVDFQTPDDVLSRWVRRVDVDRLVDVLGNIPGELLNWTFLQLRPLRLGGQKYLDMVEALDDPGRIANFLRMERWIRDSPDQAGEAFREFIKYFYQQNALVQGSLTIGGRAVELSRVQMPLLNIYATEDHIVPPAASLPLEKYVHSRDYSTVAFPGGHIGIYVSRRAVKEVPATIGRWLRPRSRL